MTIETKSAHVTPAGGNVFADLGFSPEQSSVLKANSQRIISEKLAIKNSLMGELAKWIDDNQLKQIEISSELTHQLDLIKQLRQAYLREAMQGKLVGSAQLKVGSETGHDLLAKIKAE